MAQLRARPYSENREIKIKKLDETKEERHIRCDHAYQTDAISRRDKRKGIQVLQRTLRRKQKVECKVRKVQRKIWRAAGMAGEATSKSITHDGVIRLSADGWSCEAVRWITEASWGIATANDVYMECLNKELGAFRKPTWTRSADGDLDNLGKGTSYRKT